MSRSSSKTSAGIPRHHGTPLGDAVPVYTLELSHLRRSAWLGLLGLIQRVTKQEAFCWILYGSSNASTVMRFAKGEPATHVTDLLLALFTYWSLYSASADYSTRFNADGLDHRIFYMLLAISIFVMDVNWTGDILASGNAAARWMHLSCLAGCYLLPPSSMPTRVRGVGKMEFMG
eukprot:Skav232631  [mRNA]  locus=scaffold12:182823:185860:+ [translate_table: standard]